MDEGRKPWVEPALEQISMIDTATKTDAMSEGDPEGMPMATGNSDS